MMFEPMPMKHEPSGVTCACGLHADGDKRPCIVCRHCYEKIRPAEMDKICDKRVIRCWKLSSEAYADGVAAAGLDSEW